MHLSLTPQCSWTVLWLLVSNLLLWENVASPVTRSDGGDSHRLLDTFKQAIGLSEKMNQQIKEVSDNFNRFYARNRGFEHRNTTSCHTDVLGITENKEQASQIQPEVLLKSLQSLLTAWIKPLSHLWPLMLNRLGYTPPVLTRVIEIKEKNTKILEGVKKLIDQVNAGAGRNETYLSWSGLASLQSANRDTSYFAFYNLFRCLKRDSSHVELYLKYLKYKVVQDNNC